MISFERMLHNFSIPNPAWASLLDFPFPISIELRTELHVQVHIPTFLLHIPFGLSLGILFGLLLVLRFGELGMRNRGVVVGIAVGVVAEL
jgi:hypothetical protein